MWKWTTKNAEGLEALAAMIMALTAIVAIIGVKLQIDAAATQQNAQSAREYYRGLLEITLNKPEMATFDHCTAHSPEERAAYAHYIEYVLYTAEQTISLDDDWVSPLTVLIEPHRGYICANFGQSDLHPALNDLLKPFSGATCSTVNICEEK